MSKLFLATRNSTVNGCKGPNLPSLHKGGVALDLATPRIEAKIFKTMKEAEAHGIGIGAGMGGCERKDRFSSFAAKMMREGPR